jgi:hypothetical protein
MTDSKQECKRCNVPMRPGKALVNNLGGVVDFAGDKYPVTMSPDGTAKMVDCLKCPKCGHSESEK